MESVEFFDFFSVIHFGCWREYFKLLEKIHKTSYHWLYQVWVYGFWVWAIILRFCGDQFQINGYYLQENFQFLFSVVGVVMLGFRSLLPQKKLISKLSDLQH